MYEIMKSVISAGGFKLNEIRHKIKKLYILGDLTEAETDRLLALASGSVSADAERPEILAMIQILADYIEALSVRVKALEGTGEEIPIHPVWKPWDGISKDYAFGAVVSHNGKLWRSDYNGQNVWKPGEPGTENLWVEI